MTEAKFELLLAAMREQSKELHAIHDALKRLRGISYAVYIILCILAGLAGLALLDVPFWGGSRQVRPAALFVWHIRRSRLDGPGKAAASCDFRRPQQPSRHAIEFSLVAVFLNDGFAPVHAAVAPQCSRQS